jgi:type I restriction enzyme S subunit
MGLTEYKFADLIEPVSETNSKLLYGSNDVHGMTITKEIIPTKANMTGTDLSKFLVVHPGDFIYNPRTHGKKIGFGYNNTEESFLISWNNIAFHIKPTMKDTVLSDYLFLHFKRDEWDREACFRSWGSSTEVFSWDALCDMSIELPSFPIQQKYVNVYNTMLANQKSYERGLEDLKLVCDAYIEKIRETSPITAIGRYLAPCEQRNDIGLSVDFVRGLSVSKQVITTKANMDGVSLTSYKLFPPKAIAYVADTSRRGDKMSLGFNDSQDTYLVSSISTVFKTDENYLLPEYLMLFFCRDKFDRYARFHSWGSARETFDWDEMCSVEIPVPDVTIQQDIVDIFKAYNTRKGIAETLKNQIQNICPILIKGSIEEAQKTDEA